MADYRDDLEAARQRIESLERDLDEAREGAQKSRAKGAKAPREATVKAPPDAVPAVPPRVRAAGLVAAAGFLLLHVVAGLLVLVPHVDGWAVFLALSFVVPAVCAAVVSRFARSVVDPSVGHFDPGDHETGRGPTVTYHSRRAALIVCAACVVLEAAWVGWALPTLQHASRHTCARCAAGGRSS